VNVALVPAKPLPLAKSRLAPLLGDADRMAITQAMLDDVLGALRRARLVDRVLVVTADRQLAAQAGARGASVVDEGAPRGLNGAVTLATEVALNLGAASVLVVLSDLPLVTAPDVDALLARAPERGVLLVPSKEGTGTNAFLRRPGGVVPPCFGGRSLERHVSAAERRRLACTIAPDARIAFDLDTPEDLRVFAATATATATYAEATRLGLSAFHPSA
jgi:2-phospho-L-lactate guanylyltransferase